MTKMTRKISRRTVTRQLGALASGAILLTPSIVHALLKTPTQVEGPFYPPLPHHETDVDLTLLDGHSERATGEVILVRGRVTDTEGKPLQGIRVDIWQANHNGRYDHPDDPNTDSPLDPNFQGIGSTLTDADGRYGFRTIKPAAYPLEALGDEGWRARHIHFKLWAGDATKLITQMYFEGDPLLEQDAEILGLPEAQRPLLITSPVADADTGLPLHRFDIALA
jgi:protocatechuate 3,4-dioxygenase beta subunit